MAKKYSIFWQKVATCKKNVLNFLSFQILKTLASKADNFENQFGTGPYCMKNDFCQIPSCMNLMCVFYLLYPTDLLAILDK